MLGLNHIDSRQIKINQNYNNFCQAYSIKDCDIPEDGFCFFSCIRLFFKRYFDINYTLQMVEQMILNMLNNRELSNFYHDFNIDSNIISSIRNYFSNGQYDRDIVDLLIDMTINTFNLNLIVLIHNEDQNNLFMQLYSQRQLERQNTSKLIILLNQISVYKDLIIASHYKLMIPNNHQLNYGITSFTPNDPRNSSLIYPLSSITITRNEPSKHKFHIFQELKSFTKKFKFYSTSERKFNKTKHFYFKQNF